MYKLFIFFILFFSSLYSNTFVTIDDTKKRYNNFQLLYLTSIDSSLGIQDIINYQFKKISKSNFNLGYHKNKTVWLKFTLQNNSTNKDFILSLNEVFYETANLYYYENNNWIKQSNSIFIPIQERAVKSNHLAFNLSIPQTKTTYYLELKGKYAYFGDLTLYEKSYFHLKNSFGTNILYTFIIAIVLTLILFTVFLYIKTKEIIYFYYMAYCFFNFIYFANIGGLLVYIDLQDYIYELQLAPAFMIGFLTLFSNEYLETKKYLPSFDKVLRIISIPFFIFGVMVVFQYQPWNMFINNFSGLIGIFLIILSIVIFFKGNHKTTIYTFAMLLYFVFIFMFAFMVNGTLEYTELTRYGVAVANAIEMIIFSYILANRYYKMNKDTQQYLETQIQQRTEKLNTLLNERELLIKEIHHRVKNNFHTLLGLLWIEEQNENRVKGRFEKLRNRIKSMSILHERLYKNKNIENIDIKQYIEEILNHLLYSSTSTKINITKKIDNIQLDFESSLSLGIIINEIITNSIKHNEHLNSIEISIYLQIKDNTVTLILQDNGKGFDLNQTNNSIGMDLIQSFCEKLPQSNINFETTNGVKFTLKFAQEDNHNER